jgi:hypothetical protein
VAQRLEQATHNRLVAGSNPAGPTFDAICFAQLMYSKVNQNMSDHTRENRIRKISEDVHKLSDRQFDFIEPIVTQLLTPYIEIYKLPTSDIIDDNVLIDLGDSIRIHHCLSAGPFTKDKFEYAFQAALSSSGRTAQLAPPGRRGYDLIVDGKQFSLKTEAEHSIKAESIHISKQMELGSGEWELESLREQFLENLSHVDRILTLRCLSKFVYHEYYELVEIPKSLIEKAKYGTFRTPRSKQTPKPGYCDVSEDGTLLFQLYFDGGGERKLQIKNLIKSRCTIHCFWKFSKSSYS